MKMEKSTARVGPPVTILRPTYDLFSDLLKEKNTFEEDWKNSILKSGDHDQQSKAEMGQMALDNATEFNDQLELHIKEFIRSESFRLNRDNDNRASAVISLRLGQRFLVFCHPICVKVLRMYRKGITADTRGFLLDRHGPKHSFTHRYAFDINQIGSVFSCAYTDEGIHALAKSKMSQQNVSKSAWSFHIDTSGRSCLLAISIHLTNWLANLHSKIVQHKKDGHGNPAIQSLRDVDMDIEVQDNLDIELPNNLLSPSTSPENNIEVFMEYEYPDVECKWFQEVIWTHVATSVQELGRSISVEVLNSTDRSGVMEVKPKRGSKRKVLLLSNMVSSNTVLEYILRPSNYATMLCENVLQCIAAIFHHEKIMSYDDMKHIQLSSDLFEMTRDLYINMLQTIEYSMKCENETIFKSQNVMQIFQSGFQLFSSTRKSRMKYLHARLLGKREIREEEEIRESARGEEDNNNGEMHTAKRCPICHRDWPDEMEWPPPQFRLGHSEMVQNDQDYVESKPI